MEKKHDVIIVGARCAGSPTGMLLARKGHRVLVVDRATFPSDTLSSHIVQPSGVAALARWGLLDRLVATGCPPIKKFTFDFGPVTISGKPGRKDFPVAYCPRRTVLDKLLIDAAAEAGAEVREGYTVKEVLTEDSRVVGIKGTTKDGRPIMDRARVVIGADGWHSIVAEAVHPERYDFVAPLSAAYYSYWSNLPTGEQAEVHIRAEMGFGAAPTHDGLTLIIGGWPYAHFSARKDDVEGNFTKMLMSVPGFADRLRGARREARFAGATLPNYFHTPYGPGWALVGDAGYIKDSITAQGIADAFLDAERVSTALDDYLSGRRSFDEAMEEYRQRRDQHARPIYEFTLQSATLAPPPPEMQQLLGAIQGNQEAMDAFAQMNTGTITQQEFMSSVSAGMSY